MFSSKCETFALQVWGTVAAYACVAELFLKWRAQVHVKKLENFCDLNWQLWHHKYWNMTSFAFFVSLMYGSGCTFSSRADFML